MRWRLVFGWALSASAAFAQSAPPGPSAALVAAAPMRVELNTSNTAYPLSAEGGIWSNVPEVYFGLDRDFGAGQGGPGAPSGGLGGGPVATLFAMANNTGSPSDVVAVLGDAVVRVPNGSGFGANFIARSGGGGLTGLHLVVAELDVEPAAGDAVGSGAGLAINGFSSAMPIPAIQINGIGGSFGNGIVLGGVTGAGLAPNTGATTMASLVDGRNGTYAGAAIMLGAGASQGVVLAGPPGGVAATLFNGVDGYAHLTAGAAGFAVANAARQQMIFDRHGTFTAPAISSAAITTVTAPAGANGAQVADTAFVQAAIGHAASLSIASAATIAPQNGITHVTGTTAIRMIAPPYAGFVGCINLVPDAAWTTQTGGNIALASIAVVGRQMQVCFDGTTWYPSY